MTIDSTDVTADTVESVLNRLDDLSALDRAATAAIREDLDGGADAAAPLYFHHHLDELPESALRDLFGTANRNDITRDAFFSRLHLVRVGLYPETDDAQILLDYSIGPDVTDYLLCVTFDSEGEVAAVDLES